MSITQIKGNQIQDGTIKSADVDDGLEKDFTKVRVTTGDSSPDFLSSKIIAGDNITLVVVGSSGSAQYLAISSSASGGESSGQDFFSSATADSIITTGSVAFRGQEQISSPSAKGQDVFFYVSGTLGSSSSPKISLFGGDVVVSGSLNSAGGLSATGNSIISGDGAFLGTLTVLDDVNVEGKINISSGADVTGSVKFVNGLSGSLTNLIDGSSYLIAGSGISITTGSTGAVTVASTAPTMNGGNGTNNNIITADGSGGLVAEPNMSFNGSVLNVTGSIILSSLNTNDRVLITSGSSRTISQANLLFWDNTNSYLGAGVSQPARNVHASSGIRLGVTDYLEWVQANSTTQRFVGGGSTSILEFNNDVLLPAGRTLGFQSALSSAKDSGFSRAAAGIINVSGSAPGAVFRFNATSTPLSAGDLGMNVSSGRPVALISGSVRQMAHIDELAPLGSAFVTIGNDSTLTGERALTAGNGITITDGGANSTVTISGKFLGGTYVQNGAYGGEYGANITTVCPVDDTIPQLSEGQVILTTPSYTVKSSTSKLKITAHVVGTTSAGVGWVIHSHRDSTANAEAVSRTVPAGGSYPTELNLMYRVDSPGAGTSLVYKIVAGAQIASTPVAINGAAGSRNFGGVYLSTLSVEEYEA